MNFKLATLLTILLLSSGQAFAGAEDVVIKNAWSRATIGVERPGVAYMTIRNAGKTPLVVIGLQTPAAQEAAIHRTETDDNGVSTMSPAGDVSIAPGNTVVLEPGGLHAMLMDLKAPLEEGQSFALKVIFEDGTHFEVEVPVLDITARGPRQ